MKKIVLALIAFVAYQGAYAHSVHWEGQENSNADVLYNGLRVLAATNPAVVFKNGHYGRQVSIEDDISAVYCENLDSDVKTFKCAIYVKHGMDLGPLDSYPLGDSADTDGGAGSNADLISQVLTERAKTDDSVDVIATTGNISRDGDDMNISCKKTANGDVFRYSCSLQR